MRDALVFPSCQTIPRLSVSFKASHLTSYARPYDFRGERAKHLGFLPFWLKQSKGKPLVHIRLAAKYANIRAAMFKFCTSLLCFSSFVM
jgi:hypothetical protein